MYKNKSPFLIPCFLFLLTFLAYADNPLVTNIRTADPAPLVYGGRFYIVCGQDEVNTNAFDMYAWHLLSSTDMRNWTDHGIILRPGQISWIPDNRAWASQIIYHDNHFYFFASGDDMIGVMRADSITGPYTDVNKAPLVTPATPGAPQGMTIDPTVLIDDDGTPYMFYGLGNCRYVRLSGDLCSLAGPVLDVPGLNNYLEAPFIFKNNNIYFLMYATNPWPSEIRYATSNSIHGPWTHKGVIGTATGSGTNHEGAAFYKGQWWYTYHTEELSGNNPYSRSVCVDKMYINGDTISPVVYTDNNGGGTLPSPGPTPPPLKEPVWKGGPFDLNGATDYVKLPEGIMRDWVDFSVATWVLLHQKEQWCRLFDFGAGPDTNMFLTPSSPAGNLRFAITTGGNGAEQRIDGLSVPMGNWVHLAVVKNGSTGILYQNGEQTGINETLNLSPAHLGNTLNNYIGRSQYASDPYLDGEIENFRIYNRALAPGEISSLASGQPGSYTPGDVNSSGDINIVDALMVAQSSVGLSPPGFNSEVADVDCSGSITILDALMIAQRAVGLLPHFNC